MPEVVLWNKVGTAEMVYEQLLHLAEMIMPRKSSYLSGDGGHCVELARLSGGIGVRDSKDPGGPKLITGHPEFAALVEALKR